MLQVLQERKEQGKNNESLLFAFQKKNTSSISFLTLFSNINQYCPSMSNFPLDQNSKNETINEISLVGFFLADALGRKLFRR